ncbi:ricin-type beta-trefoil lectin domain protein, partial [Burkholderia pyrrocinia]|uniref:ricin-type beta-trefoil lectin domain protein n=1 Tax=Burkholderia pyrrocinia TaxID=60550 RepID=UPI001ABA122C
AACDQVGSMIASDIPLKNIENLSERARPPLWVAAGDGTLQTKYSYCLTAQAPSAGNGALLRTCVAGEADQQWLVKAGTAPGSAQLVSQPTGRCLAPAAGGTLSLQTCAAATAVWTTPGKSFAY